MKLSLFAPIVLATLTMLSTGAVAQRHDAPGARHGVVQVSGTGVIRAVDAARKKVTLEHQTIQKFRLEAATHEFDVKDPGSLKDLKAGDSVDFRLESSGQELVVVQIRKVN